MIVVIVFIVLFSFFFLVLVGLGAVKFLGLRTWCQPWLCNVWSHGTVQAVAIVSQSPLLQPKDGNDLATLLPPP